MQALAAVAWVAMSWPQTVTLPEDAGKKPAMTRIVVLFPSSAIGSEKAEHLTRLDLEAQVVDR